MSIDRTDDVSQAVENILEARDALFDGLIVSGFDDPSYVSAVKRAHDENPVMVLGSLEAYRMINLKTLAHVGDEEMDVGRLAGNVMQEAGMKVNAAAAEMLIQHTVHASADCLVLELPRQHGQHASLQRVSGCVRQPYL